VRTLDGLLTVDDLKAAAEATGIFADASSISDDEARWAQATRDTMRLLIHCAAATRGYPAPQLPVRIDPEPMTAGCKAIARIPVTAEWSAPELGPIYEHLLAARPGKARNAQGSWFTPPAVAEFMGRFALDIELNRLAQSEDPNDMLQIVALDPACGAGVFPLQAARHIAARFAERCFGLSTPAAVRVVMPDVLSECIFGIDIDPIAVELTKAALWLEVGDTEPFSFMDRNVICGNALERDEPPKLVERMHGGGKWPVAQGWVPEAVTS
jgi:N-6 DNA Methylase